jgi:hypothetical protein
VIANNTRPRVLSSVLRRKDASSFAGASPASLAYVSVSRASQDAQIFTNNLAQLTPQLSADISKTSAIKIGQSAVLAPEIALT